MSPEHASQVKLAGHTNEEQFAALIGGQVRRGLPTEKPDVIDQQQQSHSVKAGTYWQIFLYSKERLLTNTNFREIGDIADIMIDCLDAYPPTYAGYKANRMATKLALQPHMRRLLAELQKDGILCRFFAKALFNAGGADNSPDGGEADYLSIYPGLAKDPANKKTFHVFDRDDVVNALMTHIEVRNSKARNAEQMDDQKVIFYSKLHGKNMGELEDRHDSEIHYRQMKCRFKSDIAFNILQEEMKNGELIFPQVYAYGKARSLIRP